MPTTPKTPQDHQKKKSKAPGRTEPFSFDVDGETYTLKSLDSLTTGWLRQNRRRTEVDALFTMFEALLPDNAKAAKATLDALEEMSQDEFSQLQDDFNTHNGVRPGESIAS